jgi:hypothetical protein
MTPETMLRQVRAVAAPHMLVEVADEPVNEGRRDLGEPQGSKGRKDMASELALVGLDGSR